ncbi:MAG: Crp/Fnr family transcriptional regulator [Bacteroidetes bacterium]|nr:Crp/Fnr family transcriptional regulator [Bacteroidota bacterium]
MNTHLINKFIATSELRSRLVSYGISKTYEEGDIIVNENAYIRAIPIVLRGVIRVTQADDENHEILLYYILPGESCIMSFLGGMHHETSKIKAIADEPTEILLIPIEKVSKLIAEFPEWLDYIFRLYHKRFEELLEVVNSIAFKKLDQRLHETLVRKSEINNRQPIQLTHEQLASELGTARVVVSRLLKQMETEGLIQLGRNKITVM